MIRWLKFRAHVHLLPSSLLALSLFSLLDGQISAPQYSVLGCILRNWDRFDDSPSPNLKKKLIFFCNTAWPQYKLDNQEAWPENGNLNDNTILQLELFCCRESKFTEVPCVHTAVGSEN